jgi:hypothetical protein
VIFISVIKKLVKVDSRNRQFDELLKPISCCALPVRSAKELVDRFPLWQEETKEEIFPIFPAGCLRHLT